MNLSEQRKKLRAVFAGSKCVVPASVYDPLSARIAEAVGYELGLLMGSLASNAALAAPDLILLSLTEYAEQIRRITRVSGLSLMVDADHGYGNALNVMRTIQELEHAGVSGLTIEDTVLPLAFGQGAERDQLISLEEAVGKMRAAVAARGDPSLVIVARTSALNSEGVEGAVARTKAYAAAGIDAIFLSTTSQKFEEIKAVHDATKLPIMLALRGLLTPEELVACGVRTGTPGFLPFAAAVKALQETYTHLFKGGAPADLKSKIASPQEMERLVNGERYKQWLREYMH